MTISPAMRAYMHHMLNMSPTRGQSHTIDIEAMVQLLKDNQPLINPHCLELEERQNALIARLKDADGTLKVPKNLKLGKSAHPQPFYRKGRW